MKRIKLLPLALLSVISIGVHNFPAQAESSEWELAQVGDGYTSSSVESCVPTMSLSSGTDDCGNPLISEPSETEGDKDESSNPKPSYDHIGGTIKGIIDDLSEDGDLIKAGARTIQRCQQCHE
jgi:hypothetical protein